MTHISPELKAAVSYRQVKLMERCIYGRKLLSTGGYATVGNIDTRQNIGHHRFCPMYTEDEQDEDI